MIVIGLTGKKRSGKDTAAQMIQEYFPHAKRLAFADKLKESVSALFQLSRQEVDALKNMEHKAMIQIKVSGYSEPWDIGSMRTILQRMGTEVGRDIYAEDFWLEMAFKNTQPDGFYVVTDCRFDNEAEYIQSKGGVIWEILRPSVDEGDNHASEIPINRKLVDDVIENTSDLETFRQKIYARLDRMKVQMRTNANTGRR